MKYFVGCCVAWSCAPLLQSTVVVITSCNTTYQSMLVAVIHTINSSYCCHPCNQLHMYNLIVVSSCLTMVGLLSLHAPWQYNCFLQHQSVMLLLLLQYDIESMLVVIASCGMSSFAIIILNDSIYYIWLLCGGPSLPYLHNCPSRPCNGGIIVLLFAPSWCEIKNTLVAVGASCNQQFAYPNG